MLDDGARKIIKIWCLITRCWTVCNIPLLDIHFFILFF